jgi:uncharacterized protein (TIGR02231 family)
VTDLTAHPTRATRVTFFEDRAEVVRRATLTSSAGTRWEALAGISLLVDDGTVQAKVVGGEARVLAARVRRRAHTERTLGREEIEALEQKAREARARAAEAELAIDRAKRTEVQVVTLSSQWAAAIALAPKGAAKPDVLGRYGDAWRALDRAAEAAMAESAAARKAQKEAEDERTRAEQRLAEGRVEKPRYDAVIEVELESAQAGEVEVEVTYRLPCAVWRPEHLARLSTDGPEATKGKVEIVTYATAWQRTGEAWEDVPLRFSTARPARAASPPELRDDVLYARRKTDEERRQVVVAAREQAIAAAGAEGTRAVDEMPGVDDGGEPVLYEAKERVTIPSNGRPFRVEIGRTRLAAEVSRVLLSARSPVSHVRAKATLEGKGPLLAGPVLLGRGASMIGRARLSFVGAGEPFELGFGPDDAIRARRTEDEERDTQAITGAQRIKRKVSLYLSNLSGDAKRVLVTERIPVSEIEDLEIALLDAGPFTLDEKDGFLKATVEVEPHGMRTITFTYEVRASSKVVLPAF